MNVFDDMVSFLDASYTLKNQLVPCLIGPVGIGKTAAVLKHAENVGAENVVTIIASQILPNEVSGITMPVNDTKSMEIFDHYKLSSLQDGDILFFDELLEADQSVLSACLTLIESRQMMSGKKLPDIQIIAATNPTIQPSMLKENIRQRFIFRKFYIDQAGCARYIKEQFGLQLTRDILNKLVDTGNEYNILSPRSLTKMVQWIAEAPEDKLNLIADNIDAIWNNDLGSKLKEIRLQANSTPIKQTQKAIADALEEIDDDNYNQAQLNQLEYVKKKIEEEVFNETTLEECFDIIKNYTEIVDKLSVIQITV